MSVLDVLLEGFAEGKHPRGWHGRFVGSGESRVLHVFHGSDRVGRVKAPASAERVQTMIGVGKAVGAAGRTISTKDLVGVVDKATGSSSAGVAKPRAMAARQAQARGSRALAAIQREQALRGGAAHVKGDKVHVVTPQGHVDNGVVQKPAESYDVITSRGTERSRTITVKWADGDVTHERPQDVQPGHRRAAVREAAPGVLDALLSERFVSQDKRSELASKGHALHVDGKDIFPISTAADAKNAVTLWLSGHHKTAQAKAHIVRNARRVGATDQVARINGGG